MSQLVEEYFFVNLQAHSQRQPNSLFSPLQLLDGLTLLINKARTDGYDIKVLDSKMMRPFHKLKVLAHIRYNSSLLDSVVEIQLDLKNKKLKYKTSFMERDQYYLTESSCKRKIMCRKLLKINNKIQLAGFKFIQNMQNGKIILLGIQQEPQTTFNSKQNIWNKIKKNLQKISQLCSNYAIEIIRFSNKERFKKYYIKNGGPEFQKIKKDQISYAKLVKKLQVSHINFELSSKADQSSFSSTQKSKNHEVKLKQFFMNTFWDDFETKPSKLFSGRFQDFYQIPLHQISYELQEGEAITYRSYLKKPVPRDPHPGQNKFIFNKIQLVNPQSIKFRQTGLEGGQSKIMIAKASFYYSNSEKFQKVVPIQTSSILKIPSLFSKSIRSNQKNSQKKETPVLTKILALKVPKKKNVQKQIEKYQNEKNIICVFKNAVSAYVLKYYVSTQRNFLYKDNLLMDLLSNCQPLSNYIQIFKDTLSLYSEAYIIVNLSNSLRFLCDYQIVHMDLNLNNFLVYRDYLTKMIDFGEAYNMNRNNNEKGNFKRGYTFPFCPPEYFHRKINFTGKQDIFSLGIIIWRLIFDNYPFTDSKDSIKSYKDKSYIKKIFLAPERGEWYAELQTIDFIYRLVFKCFDPNELLRCQASWLTIFFKIIYFYLL